MATSTTALAQIATACEVQGLTVSNGEKIALELAKTFQVKPDEVGILRLEKDALVFVHPAKLHQVGRIPLNSPTSLAARTVHSRRAEIVNNFARARHTSFFETVDLSPAASGKKADKGETIIQKLMTAPVIVMNQVAGVLQICRKGKSAAEAGADFTAADLQKLVAMAATLAKCFTR